MRHAILKSLVLILSIISVTSLALAQEEVSTQNESVTRQRKVKKVKYLEKFNSVNNYTLGDGQHEVKANAQYVGSNYFAKLQDSTSFAEMYAERTGMSATAQYAYGISKHGFLALNIGYRTSDQNTTVYTSSGESKSTSKFKGMSGISLQSGFAYDLGGAGLYSQVAYSPQIGTSSFDENTREGNAYSEQSSLELKVTLALNASAVKYGFNVNSNIAFAGEDETITSTQKITNKVTGGGGYGAGTYIEFSDFGNLNLSAMYMNSNSRKYTKPDGNSWNDVPAQQYIHLSSAMKIDLGQDFSIVPEAMYLTVLNKKVENIEYDQVNFYSFTLGLRKAF